MKDHHNRHDNRDHKEPPHEERGKKPKRRKKHGGFILILLLIIIILILIIVMFDPFGWGGGSGFLGSSGGNSADNSSSSAESDSDVSDTIVIKIDENTILIDGEECADENELKDKITDIGTDKKYELDHSTAIKETYDKVKSVLTELQDALNIEVDYNE